MKPVAIYARVSSERQKEQEAIASQTAALLEHAAQQSWTVPPEWQFLDEGPDILTSTGIRPKKWKSE